MNKIQTQNVMSVSHIPSSELYRLVLSFHCYKVNKLCNRQYSKLILIQLIQVQRGAELSHIPDYQKSPSWVVQGHQGPVLYFLEYSKLKKLMEWETWNRIYRSLKMTQPCQVIFKCYITKHTLTQHVRYTSFPGYVNRLSSGLCFIKCHAVKLILAWRSISFRGSSC